MAYPAALVLAVAAALTPPAVILGLDADSVAAAAWFLCLPGWLALTMEAMHRALTRRYPGFEVALEASDPPADSEEGI